MIKYLLVFILFAQSVFAGGVMFQAGGVEDVGGALVDQDFNVVGYNNGETWTPVGTPDVLDPDSTLGVAPLEGIYSLYIDATSSGGIQGIITDFVATSDVNFKATFNIQTLPDDTTQFLVLYDSIGGLVSRVRINATGDVSGTVVGDNIALVTASLDTTYYVWMDVVGTNSSTANDVTFYISVTDVKPTATGTITSTGTTDAETLELSSANLMQIFLDKVGVSEDVL